jgi:hypothetical protein
MHVSLSSQHLLHFALQQLQQLRLGRVLEVAPVIKPAAAIGRSPVPTGRCYYHF